MKNLNLRRSNNKKVENFIRRVLISVVEWVKIIVLALIIVIPIRTFIFQPFIVKGQSMLPTLNQNDYLIIDQITYRFREPRRYDIVVFKYPKNPSQYYVKRIIGLPGERVVIKEAKVYIYNSIFPEGFLLDEDKYLSIKNSPIDNIDLTLDRDEYFVMGDNRLQSYDSRYWGPVKFKYLVGRVLLRIWPVNHAQAYFNN